MPDIPKVAGRDKLDEKVLHPLPQFIKQDVMNTLEIYTKKGRQEGFEKRYQKDIEIVRKKVWKKFKEEKDIIVETLIKKLGLNDQQAAEIAEVLPAF